MTEPAFVAELAGRVQAAAAAGTPLRLRGGGSKDFYGSQLAGEVVDLAGHRGIIAYEPTELYLTARCGTPLADIEAALAEQGQMLACEPPRFGAATLGGCIAAGLSGPRRQQAGALRDFVLGVSLMDGRGQVLKFGGQVIKNVAGYDVSRLVTGSLGSLGVILEASLKVLPRPAAETTRVFELDQATAIARLNRWGGQSLPVSASFWHGGRLWLRLSGARAAVAAASALLGGETLADGAQFWASVREQTHPAFAADLLWRLALPSTRAPLDPVLPGTVALEWGGGLRWLASDANPEALREAVAELGGHATLYKAPESLRLLHGAFTPLAPAALALQRRLKAAFDPAGIFNPGRLYEVL